MFCHRCRLLKLGNNFHKMVPLRAYRLFLIDSCTLGEENPSASALGCHSGPIAGIEWFFGLNARGVMA
ncbi:MAG: hypothetical protein CBD74_11285 [Saprospirales bacterium TMED214]|nr:MAG: hypothetical protein CBD74_11285 [Saprospirales bacterium TMED214]